MNLGCLPELDSFLGSLAAELFRANGLKLPSKKVVSSNIQMNNAFLAVQPGGAAKQDAEEAWQRTGGRRSEGGSRRILFRPLHAIVILRHPSPRLPIREDKRPPLPEGGADGVHVREAHGMPFEHYGP